VYIRYIRYIRYNYVYICDTCYMHIELPRDADQLPLPLREVLPVLPHLLPQPSTEGPLKDSKTDRT
jgi:hypothetical protein